MNDDEEAVRRLGLRFIDCEWCRQRFAYRDSTPHICVFRDGEIEYDPDIFCCSVACANKWVERFNNSTDRTLESEHREATVLQGSDEP